MKVGGDINDDIRRAKIFRETIGYDRVWVCNQTTKVQTCRKFNE